MIDPYMATMGTVAAGCALGIAGCAGYAIRDTQARRQAPDAESARNLALRREVASLRAQLGRYRNQARAALPPAPTHRSRLLPELPATPAPAALPASRSAGPHYHSGPRRPALSDVLSRS